jgi:hypothetical protein
MLHWDSTFSISLSKSHAPCWCYVQLNNLSWTVCGIITLQKRWSFELNHVVWLGPKLPHGHMELCLLSLCTVHILGVRIGWNHSIPPRPKAASNFQECIHLSVTKVHQALCIQWHLAGWNGYGEDRLVSLSARILFRPALIAWATVIPKQFNP